ncbi:MAG: PTS sugar transporter subunit IIA [Gammaproteobacteria bacterium]|nr:PTS sugar transporter subunit IIA [Gammaproteobacteria bacterium]
MQLAELISVERIACGVDTASKKRALEHISELICTAAPTLNPTEVFESLIAREKLGSTGLGKGVAIPHGRLKSGEDTIVAFLQLSKGVDFDSPDGQPVDLLCALMVPPESTDEHLQILAQLSEIFRQADLREKLREAKNPQELCGILVQSSATTHSE